MPNVLLDDRTHEKLRVVAGVLGLTEAQAVGELIRRLEPRSSAGDDLRMAIHAVYKGARVEGLFDPKTNAVEITTGSLAGQRFVRPSPAAVAVVRSIDPAVSPARNGWNFWLITDTGAVLQSARRT